MVDLKKMARFIESDNLGYLGGIRHGFFTRKGGVSDGLYAWLNCGFGSDDNHTNVAANRARIAARLKTNTANLITPYQTHSATVVVATQPWTPEKAPKADAIVTQTTGLAIGILTADCAPVIFADIKAGIIAVAHAGWRGAIGGILEATIEAMVCEGARRNDIKAALGPCLHQPSYEVGPEFRANFNAANPDYSRYFSKNGDNQRPFFDLPGFVMHRLKHAGLTTIANLDLCTYENESLFFSYRRNTHQNCSDYGRQISAIVLT